MTTSGGSGIFGVLPVDTDELLREHTQGMPLEQTLTDTGNGHRFRDVMAGVVRYSHDTRQWYAWDGHRLRPDPGGSTGRVFRDTEKVLKAIRDEANNPPDGLTVEQMMSWANRASSVRSRQAMMTVGAALTPIAVTSDQLDGDPWLLGVQNGVIELETQTLRPGLIDDLITQQAAVAYDKDAGCPLWEAHIDYVTSGQRHIADYLQLALGYTLTGLVTEDAYWMLHGQGGTGKSVIIETVQMMLGDYGLKASQRMLTGGTRAHTTELTDIRGKRLAFIDELEDDSGINEARVKMIAGNPYITARGIARNDETFPNYTKLWIATNALPRIKDATDGTYRRTKALRCDRIIQEQDPGFTDKLRAEWPGILNWCLAGLRRWREECYLLGTKMPVVAEITANVAEYRHDEDPVYAWLDECCVVGAEAATDGEYVGSLFGSFMKWCEKGNRSVRSMDIRWFGRALALHGLRKGKRKYHNGEKEYTYTGVRLGVNELERTVRGWPKLSASDIETV